MGVMRTTRSDSAARPEPSAADRERLARRYPAPRLPRPVLIAIVAVVAVGSLSWLIWTALVHAEPVVSAKVAAYTVVSDSRIDATVIIDRPVNLPVEATPEGVVNTTISITTVRRATTAVIRGCSPA